MKKNLSFAILIIALFLLACKSKTKSKSKLILGKWEYVRFDKTSTEPYITVEEVNNNNKDQVITFDKEGNFIVFKKTAIGIDKIRSGKYSFTKDETRIITVHTSQGDQRPDTAEIASLTEKLMRIYNPKKDIMLFQKISENE